MYEQTKQPELQNVESEIVRDYDAPAELEYWSERDFEDLFPSRRLVPGDDYWGIVSQ